MSASEMIVTDRASASECWLHTWIPF